MNFTTTFRIAMLLTSETFQSIVTRYLKISRDMLIGIKWIFQKVFHSIGNTTHFILDPATQLRTPPSDHKESFTSQLSISFSKISSNIYYASKRTINYLKVAWKALKAVIINENQSSNHLKEQLIQEEQLFDTPELQDTAPTTTPISATIATAPITATPIDTAPSDTVPTATPIDTAPIDTVPIDTAPIDTSPIDIDTAPIDTAPTTAPTIVKTTVQTTTTPITRTWASILAPNSQIINTNIISPNEDEKKEVYLATTANSTAINSTTSTDANNTLQSSLYTEIQFKTEIPDDNASTDIYKIIIKLATNHATGQLSESVSLDHLSNIILAKNYTLEQLNNCIYEYECLNIWNTTDESLTVRSKKCKKNKRSRR